MAFQPSKKQKSGDSSQAAKVDTPHRSLLSIQVGAPPPKASRTGEKRPNNSPLQLGVTKYTGEGADLVRSFPAGLPAFAITISHKADPSMEFALIRGLQGHLTAEHAENPDMPQDLRALRQNEHIVVVLSHAGEYNNEDMPIVEWAPVVYVGGAQPQLRNTLAFLGAFFVYRVNNPVPEDKSPWPPMAQIPVHLHPHVGVDLAGTAAHFDSFDCHLQPASRQLPLSIFQVAPPGSVRALLVEVEVLDDSSVVIAWTGKTFDYRQRFNTAGVPRCENGDMRLLQESRRDVGQPDNVAFILSIFEGAVFRSHVCAVKVTGVEPPADSAAALFLQTLKDKDYIYVDAW